MTKLHFIFSMAVTIVALLCPLIIYPIFLMDVYCFALFACAFNLLMGFSGLLSFGHAAFFAAGAYAAGYAMKAWGFTPELGIVFGSLIAAAVGGAVGGLAIRRQGIYFAMITLALAQMIYFFFLEAPFTGGEDGLQSIPRSHLFGVISLNNDLILYYVVLATTAFGLWFLYRIVHSPFGQILKSIRENEQRTLSLGYDVPKAKLLAFVLSAGISGMAGATKALVFGFATLTDAHWQTSGEVVLMALIGGSGTIFGPAIGAALVVTLQNELADKVGSKVTILLGLTFIICVHSFRRGIAGELARWRKKLLAGPRSNAFRLLRLISDGLAASGRVPPPM
jgi:branched-chain amino acid transport system permease protein